jgi:hypothetical protein
LLHDTQLLVLSELWLPSQLFANYSALYWQYISIAADRLNEEVSFALEFPATLDGIGAAIAVGVVRHDTHGAFTTLTPLSDRRPLHVAVERAALAIVIIPMPEVIVVHGKLLVCYWPITSKIVHGV